MPCDTAQCAAENPRIHAHMEEQPMPLDGTDGVSSGAPNGNAEGRDAALCKVEKE